MKPNERINEFINNCNYSKLKKSSTSFEGVKSSIDLILTNQKLFWKKFVG